MSLADRLRKSAQASGSLVCMGADPVLDKIPVEGDTETKIVKFFSDILDAAQGENTIPGAFKPNYAFYAQYGFEGLRAYHKVCEKAKSMGIPLVVDAKRADIGKTSTAYAKEVFEFWGGDAVTLHPYMGTDSVSPFIEHTKDSDRGVFVLNRTSNAGAADFQSLAVDGKPFYLKVAEKIEEWNKTAPGNVGTVVGATSTAELADLAKFFAGKDIPMLIPGVGAQGGTATEVIQILRNAEFDVALSRINSSSGINYAYQKMGTDDYAGAAVKAIAEMNKEIGYR